MSESNYEKYYLELAEEFLDYLKYYSYKLEVPEELEHQRSMLELIKLEQEMTRYFADTLSSLGAKNDRSQAIAAALETVKQEGRKYISSVQFANLRPYSTALRKMLEDNDLPSDLRENMKVLDSIIIRAVKLDSKRKEVNQSDEKRDLIEQWRDRLSDGLGDWRKQS